MSSNNSYDIFWFINMCSQLSNDDLSTKDLNLYHTRKNFAQKDETLILKYKFKTNSTRDKIIKIYKTKFYEITPLTKINELALRKDIEIILYSDSAGGYCHFRHRAKCRGISEKNLIAFILIYNIYQYRYLYNNNWNLVDKRITIKPIQKINNYNLYFVLSRNQKKFITCFKEKDKNTEVALTINGIRSPRKIINKLSNYISYLLVMHNALTSNQIYTLNNNKKYNIPNNIKKEFNPLVNDIIYYNPDTEPNIKELIVINLECNFLNNKYFNNYYHIDNYNYKEIVFSSCIGIQYNFKSYLFQILMLLIVDTSNESQQILDCLKSKIDNENISANDIPIIIISRKSKCPLNYYNFKIIETNYSCQSIPQKIKDLCLMENFTNKYLLKLK